MSRKTEGYVFVEGFEIQSDEIGEGRLEGKQVEADRIALSSNEDQKLKMGQNESEQGRKNMSSRKTPEDFVFGKELGVGSFATVKHAVEVSTGHEFAVKVVDKEHIKKTGKLKYVQTEKTILNTLRHPNVIFLYCTFQDSKSLYYVVELCPNGELLDLIKKYGHFSSSATQFYAAELVLGIEYMHSKGIVHRDLKPENVLLNPGMHAKINDFGTAKALGSDIKARSSSFTGTAEYIPPELLETKEAGFGADLWALGCIIYQMMVGRPPFKGSNEYQTLQLVSQGHYTYPPWVPHIARDVIDMLLEPDPEKRLGVGVEGMKYLKYHPFFKGIDWDRIPNTTPPRPDDQTPVFEVTAQLVPRGVSSKSITPTSPVVSSPKVSIMREDRNFQMDLWGQFLKSGEDVVCSGGVAKRNGLFLKKRQLILTANRLLIIDADSMQLKGEIDTKETVKAVLKTNKKFVVETIEKTWKFEDESSGAHSWVAQINFVFNSRRTI